MSLLGLLIFITPISIFATISFMGSPIASIIFDHCQKKTLVTLNAMVKIVPEKVEVHSLGEKPHDDNKPTIFFVLF